MRKLVPALAAGAALCALPSAANAATAFQLGTGSHPDVAVDGTGSAHIVVDLPDETLRKLSPRRRVKIKSVVFSVDRTKRTDRRAAFKAAFSTARMPRGSFHNVRAVVTLAPVEKGAFNNKKKTLKGRFNVCG